MMKGRPRACAPERCVQTMHLFEEAYILYSCILFGKKKIYIELLTPIMEKNECGYESHDDYVLIKRVGKGFDDKDYEIDFTQTKSVFVVATEKQTKALDREQHLYLIIENTGFEIASETSTTTLIRYAPTLEQLEDEMTEVLEKEDYPRAAILKEEIEKKKNMLNK